MSDKVSIHLEKPEKGRDSNDFPRADIPVRKPVMIHITLINFTHSQKDHAYPAEIVVIST